MLETLVPARLRSINIGESIRGEGKYSPANPGKFYTHAAVGENQPARRNALKLRVFFLLRG